MIAAGRPDCKQGQEAHRGRPRSREGGQETHNNAIHLEDIQRTNLEETTVTKFARLFFKRPFRIDPFTGGPSKKQKTSGKVYDIVRNSGARLSEAYTGLLECASVCGKKKKKKEVFITQHLKEGTRVVSEICFHVNGDWRRFADLDRKLQLKLYDTAALYFEMLNKPFEKHLDELTKSHLQKLEKEKK